MRWRADNIYESRVKKRRKENQEMKTRSGKSEDGRVGGKVTEDCEA